MTLTETRHRHTPKQAKPHSVKELARWRVPTSRCLLSGENFFFQQPLGHAALESLILSWGTRELPFFVCSFPNLRDGTHHYANAASRYCGNAAAVGKLDYEMGPVSLVYPHRACAPFTVVLRQIHG